MIRFEIQMQRGMPQKFTLTLAPTNMEDFGTPGMMKFFN